MADDQQQRAETEALLAMAALQRLGYAVIIWTPEELGDAPPRKVEDRSIEFGWEIIDDLKSGAANAAV